MNNWSFITFMLYPAGLSHSNRKMVRAEIYNKIEIHMNIKFRYKKNICFQVHSF